MAWNGDSVTNCVTYLHNGHETVVCGVYCRDKLQSGKEKKPPVTVSYVCYT